MCAHPIASPKAGIFTSVALFGILVFLIFFVSLFFVSCSQNVENSKSPESRRRIESAFVEAMHSGKNHLDQGQAGAPRAIEYFAKAISLNGGDVDAALNLANAYLRNNQAQKASEAARRALSIHRQSAAAYYLLGCSQLRLSDFTEASKALQTAKDLDHTINAVSFQLGRAYQGLNQWEEAAAQFREVVGFDPDHAAAHYNLSQVLLRLGEESAAQKALAHHQELSTKTGTLSADPSVFEKCIYTESRLPFQLEQPDFDGIEMTFKDATSEILGEWAGQITAPVGIIDVGHDGHLDLFARHKIDGFLLLIQKENRFVSEAFPHPPLDEAIYSQCLIGDLQNKSSMSAPQEDVLLISDKGCHVFRISSSGMLSDASRFAQLDDVVLEKGWMNDLDWTGKLDLIGLNPTNRSLMYFRNQGNFSFVNQSSSTNLPTHLENIRQVIFEDWDGDDLLDLFLLQSQNPSLWIRLRGGGFVETNLFNASSARSIAVGDLNNDLRNDLVSIGESLAIQFQGEDQTQKITTKIADVNRLILIDYDNDGWLDILGISTKGLRIWRNRGLEGMIEQTSKLGLSLDIGEIDDVKAADLDGDCDSDFLITLADASIKILRNEGGNQNRQLKLRLEGNRSNPSALGVKLKITAGGLRLIRTIHDLPVEIGIGKREKVDAIDPHWSDLVTTTDFELEDCSTLSLPELELPTGSCPYLYVWDGEDYRFITDLLGASPLGLPISKGKLIPANPDELVKIGEDVLSPLDGNYVIQITEELREVLYLDEAKLVAVDAPKQLAIYPMSKLVSKPPFPSANWIALHPVARLHSAIRSDGANVTKALTKLDGKMASPVMLRAPQLRGLAEAFHLDLDFGDYDVHRPLVLTLDGWLRFGGGMANLGASHNPDLPFPFPVLSVEKSDGNWQALPVEVGAPAGKTKSMIVDLEGKLPKDSGRLRLSMAFEIHWDRIALMEKYESQKLREHRLSASTSDLHWRGFSDYQNLPWDQPLSPNYDSVSTKASWLLTPSGWCTRFGNVNKLIDSKDNQLVIMNGGDELTLRFESRLLPKIPHGFRRHFFLYTSGWDKDADPHVVCGESVDPLPWHGMDDNLYGQQSHPEHDAPWMKHYNTRWVGPFTLNRKIAQQK